MHHGRPPISTEPAPSWAPPTPGRRVVLRRLRSNHEPQESSASVKTVTRPKTDRGPLLASDCDSVTPSSASAPAQPSSPVRAMHRFDLTGPVMKNPSLDDELDKKCNDDQGLYLSLQRRPSRINQVIHYGTSITLTTLRMGDASARTGRRGCRVPRVHRITLLDQGTVHAVGQADNVVAEDSGSAGVSS